MAPPRIFFFILKVKSDVYFISLSGKKREILIIYESKMQKLLSATGNLGVHLERISFKCSIVLWKALSSRNWNLTWKLEYLGSERPQTKFSEGGAFLVNWAVAPPGWCHTQFLYKFWKLCVRAFKWYLICGISSMGRWSKQQNCQEHFTAVSFVLSSTVCMYTDGQKERHISPF